MKGTEKTLYQCACIRLLTFVGLGMLKRSIMISIYIEGKKKRSSCAALNRAPGRQGGVLARVVYDLNRCARKLLVWGGRRNEDHLRGEKNDSIDERFKSCAQSRTVYLYKLSNQFQEAGPKKRNRRGCPNGKNHLW